MNALAGRGSVERTAKIEVLLEHVRALQAHAATLEAELQTLISEDCDVEHGVIYSSPATEVKDDFVDTDPSNVIALNVETEETLGGKAPIDIADEDTLREDDHLHPDPLVSSDVTTDDSDLLAGQNGENLFTGHTVPLALGSDELTDAAEDSAVCDVIEFSEDVATEIQSPGDVDIEQEEGAETIDSLHTSDTDGVTGADDLISEIAAFETSLDERDDHVHASSDRVDAALHIRPEFCFGLRSDHEFVAEDIENDNDDDGILTERLTAWQSDTSSALSELSVLHPAVMVRETACADPAPSIRAVAAAVFLGIALAGGFAWLVKTSPGTILSIAQASTHF